MSIFPFRILQELGLMAEPQALTHLGEAGREMRKGCRHRSPAPLPAPRAFACAVPSAWQVPFARQTPTCSSRLSLAWLGPQSPVRYA